MITTSKTLPRIRSASLQGHYFSSVLSIALFFTFIFAPHFFFAKPIAPNILIALSISAFFSIIFTALRKYTFVFYNSIMFFLLLYPFYIQGFFRFRYMLGGATDLTDTTILLISIFLIGTNIIGLLSFQKDQLSSERADRYAPAFHVGTAKGFFISAVFMFLILLVFGYQEIFLPRTKTIDYGFAPLQSHEKFLLGILKIAPYWVLYFYILSEHRKSRIRVFIGALPIFFVAVLVANPMNTQRFLSLFGALVIFFAILRSGYMHNIWRNTYAFAAAGLIILPITSMMRSGSIVLDPKSLASTLFSLEFSAIALLNDLFSIPYSTAKESVRLLSAVFIFIPRAIWPSKNEGTGTTIAEAAGYWYHNVGIPPIADAYLDFGLIGVLLLSIATGIALQGTFDGLSNRTSRHADIATVLKISFLGLIPIFLRGDLSTFFIAFYTSVIAFAITRALVRIKA